MAASSSGSARNGAGKKPGHDHQKLANANRLNGPAGKNDLPIK